MKIELSWSELRWLAYVGCDRRLNSLRRMTGDPKLYAKNGYWDVNIIGIFGEAAVAKALNRFWLPTIDTFKLPDVGDFQVRCTTYANGHLIIRDDDPVDDIYILVIDKTPQFFIKGWIRGRDAQRPVYWRTPAEGDPAWFVPNVALWPIERLKDDTTE